MEWSQINLFLNITPLGVRFGVDFFDRLCSLVSDYLIQGYLWSKIIVADRTIFAKLLSKSWSVISQTYWDEHVFLPTLHLNIHSWDIQVSRSSKALHYVSCSKEREFDVNKSELSTYLLYLHIFILFAFSSNDKIQNKYSPHIR